jgi:hypothetical protein
MSGKSRFEAAARGRPGSVQPTGDAAEEIVAETAAPAP